jgi:glycosyltransferase involved in cell wall biosynthesis
MVATKVSILLPVHNGARYIKQAIKSIVRQSFKSWRLFVLDDGSDDQTAKIVRFMTLQDSRIDLYSLPKRGLVATLNTGLELAQTEWVARMDADDVALPNRLERQVDWMKRADSVVASGSFVEEVDPCGWSLGEVQLPATHADIEQMLLTGIGGAICHPSAIFSRSALDAVGGYDESATYCEDLDIYLKLGEIGELANIPEVLLRYRKHPGSVNVTRRLELVRNVRDVLARVALRRRCLLPPFALDEASSRNVCLFHRECCISSLKRGKMNAALKHAIQELWSKPMSMGSWQFLHYVVRCCLVNAP